MQRLTTAPPWRHAPRFFLAEPQVANSGADRGVSGQKAPLHRRSPTCHRRSPRLTAGVRRTTPPDCP
ncbi:hypothetical protein C4B68_22830 [Streptomyces dengpaensis]|uniref:Uncharacterized protein n=1 Tax=Streptomyces dengpaensis TaxID=2049881 RepID=A0ABN5I527_9ACTN|nr:hypothetical protein C4B68_22830 [Streptomyces dengpaensis]PIB06225.1 hypothetical protein B1C81_25715 [Streptomyces sp. HG99]